MTTIKKQSALKTGLASAGALGGLYYAFTKKKSVWGYIGFFILGSIAGQLLGNAIESVTKKSTPTNPNLPSGSTNENTSSKSGDISNLTKNQKVDLIVNNIKSFELLSAEKERNLRGVLGNLSDAEINSFVYLSKGLADEEIKKLGLSGNKTEAYKIFQNKYGLSQKQVDELSVKLFNLSA